jgi:hypothetical protein
MPVFLFIAIYCAHFVLFWVPGLAAAVYLTRRHRLPVCSTLLVALTVSAILGYSVFWVYFVDHRAGWVASIIVMLAAAYTVVGPFPGRAEFRRALADSDVWAPVGLMFLVGLFYLGILYAIEYGETPEEQAVTRFPEIILAIDNIIPLRVGEALFRGLDPRALGVGDWLSSDRPPLQAGLFLVSRPLADWTGLAVGLHYQAVGTIAQMAWVAAVWGLARRAHMDNRRLALLLVFLVCTGFFLIHTVYVWPKMLSASLVMVPVAIFYLRTPDAGSQSSGQVILAAAAAALGFLAHGGILFTLLPLAVCSLLPRWFPGAGRLGIGVTVFLALVLPWLAYQRFYDPPGNRLVKWHLAGVAPVDGRSAVQAILDSYGALTWQQIVAQKSVNIEALFVMPYPLDHARSWLGMWRNGAYYNVFKALGILNVGWLVAFASLRRPARREEAALRTVVRRSLGLAAFSILIWILLMFGPDAGYTLIYQGSFATMILLFTALALLVVQLPPRWLAWLLGIQGIDFIVTWLCAGPYSAKPNFGMIALAAFAFLGLIHWWRRLARGPRGGTDGTRLTQMGLLTPSL